ncbi:putative violet-sensitive opsin [Lycodopsis pacificus]
MGKYFHLYESVSKVSPFEGPQYYLAPTWVFHLQTIFVGFVPFVGTPLNFVILLVTMKHKQLRVPLNYILVNISFILVTFSVRQVFISTIGGDYFLGHTLCAMESAMASTAGLVTAWSLAVLSLERYLIICKPFGAFTFSNSHAAAGFTWFMGIGCAIKPFFGWSRSVPEGLGCSCGPDTHNEEYTCSSSTYVLMVTCFIFPLAIIIFCYSQSLGALRAVAAQQAESESTEKEESKMIIVVMVACSVVSLCRCVVVSLCRCVVVSLCRCAVVSLCRCVVVSLFVSCRCVVVSLCRCVVVSLCRCVAVCVAVSLCRCVVVSLCSCVAVSLCRCVAVSLCRYYTDNKIDRRPWSGQSLSLNREIFVDLARHEAEVRDLGLKKVGDH